MPGDSGGLSGPDPSTLEVPDHVPKGITPISLRIPYTDTKLSDYVNLKRSDGLCIELGPPLLGIVRKAGHINDLRKEHNEALAAIGVGGIFTHFHGTVMTYARQVLPVDVLPATVGLTAAVYAIKKLWENGLLRLGQIHQASIDELLRWLGLVDEAKKNPDITVVSSDSTRVSPG